ncbi:MAG: CARDB domain-containing protein, partial [Candidatus Thermoplasmatota archaeon]|nr:CARDB domain-containing protein [Candidatus Thermoplasmatota archaeon]
EPMVNGTIDDLFACNISITNPSNFVVSNFSIVLRDQTRDTLLAERNGLSLEAHEEIGFEIELNFEVPGEHLLILTVDPEDEIREMNESNNEVEVSFNVSSRPPIVWDLGVQPGDISVDEGKDILFHAVGFRGDDTLPPVTWKVDGDEIQVGPDLNITLNFTGSLSSSGSPYNISCHLDPGSLFEGEDGIRSWILFVTDVDRAPVLNSFSPNVSSLELFEGEHVDLVVNFSDPDEEVVEIVWFLNDQVILKGRDVLNFTASFIGHNSSSSSPIMIKVVGSDPDNSSLNASMEWEIFIADVDRVPIVKIDPEPGNLNLFWNESVSLMVNISDPDNDTLLICWFVDGTVRSIDTAFLFNPGELGLGSGIWSNVTLNVLVGNFEHNYTWRIFIKENVTVVDDTPVPPAGVRIIGPEEGQTFEAGSNVTLEAVHTDTRSVLFTWYLNGSVYSGNVLEIAGLSPGNYSLVLNASTEGPPSGCFITETWFIVLE